MMIPHFGGPRDFLDDTDIANGASGNALNSTGVDGETCPDDCIDVVHTVDGESKATVKELQATDSMCYYCFDILIQELRKKSHHGTAATVQPYFVDALPSRSVECPLFVTWEKQSRPPRSNSSRSLHAADESSSYELRGCIGSLTPKTLLRNLSVYAIFSALQDHRFQPITVEEVSLLRVSVSLLIQYENCQDCYDWTVGTHGIIIKFSPSSTDGHGSVSTKSRSSSGEFSATFLPEVAAQQHWDQKKTVHQLIRKAGFKGSITDPLLKSIHCTRYQSSKCKVSFQEYLTQHLGLQSTADDDDATQFIKDMIEGTANGNAAKRNIDAATPNCCVM